MNCAVKVAGFVDKFLQIDKNRAFKKISLTNPQTEALRIGVANPDS
jgi:hypothetical protein